jgi:glutathione reductase (NADPH)
LKNKLTSMIYDVVVIGAGSGGLACARRAAQHGAKVAIVEKSRIGGTCVNLGCVPKKITFNASNLYSNFDDIKDYCFSNANPSLVTFDWRAFKEKRDVFIKKLNEIYLANLKQEGIELVKGEAKLDTENKIIQVGETEMKAKYIVIATGSHPILPKELDVPGCSRGETSDDFFQLTEKPDKVAIIGSGYIAVELAGMFRAFGSQVTIYCRQDRILTNFDREVACFLQEQLESQGIRIVKFSNVKEIKKHKSGRKQIVFKEEERNKEELDCCFDFCIWAIGRGANKVQITKGEKLKENVRGYYTVDEYQETNVSGIYAMGDVIGKFMLTPVAIKAGRYLADRLLAGSKLILEYEKIPSVIFSHPIMGFVGISEEEARKIHSNVKVYTTKFNSLYEVPMPKKIPTFLKLICVGEKEQIVGLHMVGRGSDEAIQGFAVAIKMGATKEDFDMTVAIHPTSAEEFVSMK